MKKHLAKLALTATLGLAITLTLSCGNHTFEELLGLESSSSELSSSSLRQSSSSRLGSSSSSGGSVQSGVVYGDPVTYGGETYKTVVIGTQTWFQRNLNYAVKDSKCNNNDPANCEKYGRLYDWHAAMAACPSGWHLPSIEDWDKLLRYVEGTSGTESPYPSETAGKYLKAKSGWNENGNGTDDYGFAALPGGTGSLITQNGSSTDGSVGTNGAWWSATESSDDAAYMRHINYKNDNVYYYGRYNQSVSYFSVRCLQDSPSSEPTKSEVIYGPSVSYEGETYKTVVIGNQTWMARNLNYAVKYSWCGDGSDKFVVDTNTTTCDTYGRLYSWSIAMALDANCGQNSCSGQIKAKHKGICPSGWHIPSDDDWNELWTAIGGGFSDGTKLKATSGWDNYNGKSGNGTDNYGFAALPSGKGFNSKHVDVGRYGYWWSATENNASHAHYWGISYIGGVYRNPDMKMGRLYSIRCVKD